MQYVSTITNKNWVVRGEGRGRGGGKGEDLEVNCQGKLAVIPRAAKQQDPPVSHQTFIEYNFFCLSLDEMLVHSVHYLLGLFNGVSTSDDVKLRFQFMKTKR